MKKFALLAAAAAIAMPSMAFANDYKKHDGEKFHKETRMERHTERRMWDFGSDYDNLEVRTNLTNGQVGNVQQILKNEGFYRFPVDGNWGTDTVSALLQFQRQNDLEATGRVDAKTAAKLNGFADQPNYIVIDESRDHDGKMDLELKRVSNVR